MTTHAPANCAIIGAGPAGLTAALYLLRFHRSVLLFDGGRSRARWIPTSHNCPGFPGGVSGPDLLDKLRRQIGEYGVDPINACVARLERAADGFALRDTQDRPYEARTVILASGIVDELPHFDWVSDAIHVGAMRLCAICDAYEVTDRDLATYGVAQQAVAHATFLRSYSRTVTAITTDVPQLTETERAALQERGISLLVQPETFEFDGKRCTVVAADGARRVFDAVYIVLGSKAQSGLVSRLGAKIDDNGELIVDRNQMTSIDRLFAIGDVVSAINQIAVGVGHAAVAATFIHNSLPAVAR
jgi:thioredoxin reductase (NADPH)